MNLKIKLITGFRKDQEYTIDADESHKAYYLFMNPEDRAIFKSGLALTGRDIKAIEPDYHATMGWNPDHKLDSYDYQEIATKNIDAEFRIILNHAKNIAKDNPELVSQPLEIFKELNSPESRKIADKLKI